MWTEFLWHPTLELTFVLGELCKCLVMTELLRCATPELMHVLGELMYTLGEAEVAAAPELPCTLEGVIAVRAWESNVARKARPVRCR